MPTVLQVREYRFFFFSLEGNEPPHIHVEQAERFAKFWLNPVSFVKSRGFRSGELSQIEQIIKENQGLLVEKWNEYFSR
ncbi:MAG: DUF4160 domain-containing protein [Pyrinomonadaceae bacterium]|nr:DUF4160 domain-containing protein [Pyrinomonadaceae bacterium]